VKRGVRRHTHRKHNMNEIIHGDSYEILPTLPDKSFDTVIIDPPYGMGIDTWDKPVDVAFFTEQAKRIGKEFYAVFGQMPYIREWDRQAEKAGFHFLEHISWVKRNQTPQKRLCKSHEEIYIYCIGENKKFYSNQGKYSDVKVPGLLFDIITIQAIERYISALWNEVKGKTQIYTSGSGNNAYKRFSGVNYERANELANYSNVWSFLPEGQKILGCPDKFHCTMKSLSLETRLVEMLTPENGSVIDFFSGSGTTAIACKRLDRQFLCIEKEQEFYEHSVERLAGDVWQPELDLSMN